MDCHALRARNDEELPAFTSNSRFREVAGNYLSLAMTLGISFVIARSPQGDVAIHTKRTYGKRTLF